MNQASSHRHSVVRWDIPTGQDFAAFIERFETLVPPLDFDRLRELVARQAPWSDVEQAVAANAPHDFVVFSSIDGRLLMSLAGHRRGAVQYLMGNHVVAEQMFRYHPDAVLYAPLRVLVYEEHEGGGEAVFALDQPSTVFAGLGHAEIDAVAEGLDAKVLHLLTLLGVEAPAWPAVGSQAPSGPR